MTPLFVVIRGVEEYGEVVRGIYSTEEKAIKKVEEIIKGDFVKYRKVDYLGYPLWEAFEGDIWIIIKETALDKDLGVFGL